MDKQGDAGMKVLVIGATGLVGYEFHRQKKNDKDWTFAYHTKKMDDFIRLNANNGEEVERVISRLEPGVVIMPAAMANVNRCEREPGLAWENNVGILKNVLNAMKKHGKVKIVFFSTDYLFDGKGGPYNEDAAANPINAYGRLKLECEEEIKKSGLEYLIIRTTGIYGWEKERKNFFYRVFEMLSRGDVLELPEDQYGTPIYVKDLVTAILWLLEHGKNGIYNVTGPEFINRVEVAKKFASAFGLDKGLIRGRPTREFRELAPRPLLAGLKNNKVRRMGIRIRNIDEALEDMKRNKEKDDKYPE